MIPLVLPALANVALSVFPELVKAFTGPKTDEFVDRAAKLVRDVTGTDNASHAAETLSLDPRLTMELRGKLAEINLEAERIASEERVRLETLRHQEALAHLADVANARARDRVFIEQGRSNARANFLIALAVIGIIAIVALLLVFKVDGNTAVGGALIALLGTFGSCFQSGFGFEFGTSRGSAAKDITIANMTKGS